ncbi:MAG TPA: histidine kinase [Chromatiales bacterium]|nr:histidine kinase [Chromatiales bacterium]
MLSLHLRILIAASIVLAGFFGLTGVILDQAYRNSAEAALQERLQGYAYALVAVMEPDIKGEVHLMNALPIPRFFTPDSGLYAQALRNDGRFAWQSPSMKDHDISFPVGLGRGEHLVREISLGTDTRLFSFSIGVSWSEGTPLEEVYTFSIAEDMDAFDAQIAEFRRTLWGALGAVAVLLLAVQGVILRWGLKPLRKVAEDLADIESGRKTQLEGRYPRELRTLTGNLNALVKSERDHLRRYRNALSDLAHSLKTPLALIRSTMETRHSRNELRGVVEEQVGRMDRIIEYHLQRGATSGRTVMVASVAIGPVVGKVLQAMEKIYADKDVSCQVEIPGDAHLVGDEGDLMEIMGNLMDNAFKWCRGRILVRARTVRPEDGGQGWLEITVEDDGPGIPPEMREDILERGIRGDQHVAGHGIGLAMVQDIVKVYGGRCRIESSAELGGASISVCFPA